MESIYSQAQVLSKTLEYHILGNHLFSNAKALMFAGHFFESEVGEVFLNQANTLFERELTEQFLEDGGQFELSPMYTAMAVFDILDLINIGRITSRNENSVLRYVFMSYRPEGTILAAGNEPSRRR